MFWNLSEKNALFGQKTSFEHVLKNYTFLSIHINDKFPDFLIKITGNSTTYLLWSVYFNQKCEFSMGVFGYNANFSH